MKFLAKKKKQILAAVIVLLMVASMGCGYANNMGMAITITEQTWWHFRPVASPIITEQQIQNGDKIILECLDMDIEWWTIVIEEIREDSVVARFISVHDPWTHTKEIWLGELHEIQTPSLSMWTTWTLSFRKT